MQIGRLQKVEIISSKTWYSPESEFFGETSASFGRSTANCARPRRRSTSNPPLAPATWFILPKFCTAATCRASGDGAIDDCRGLEKLSSLVAPAAAGSAMNTAARSATKSSRRNKNGAKFFFYSYSSTRDALRLSLCRASACVHWSEIVIGDFC